MGVFGRGKTDYLFGILRWLGFDQASIDYNYHFLFTN